MAEVTIRTHRLQTKETFFIAPFLYSTAIAKKVLRYSWFTSPIQHNSLTACQTSYLCVTINL